MELYQLGPGLLPELGVQVGQGFIQEKVGGLLYQGPAQGHPLLLAPGQLLGVTLGQALQVQQLDNLLGAVSDFFFRQLLQVQAKGDVVPHGHVGEQGVALEHHGNIPLAGGHVVDPLVAHIKVTAGNGFQTGNHAQGSGFAAAGGAQKNQPLPLADGQVQVPDHLDFPVDFGYVLKGQTVLGLRHGVPSFQPFMPDCMKVLRINFWQNRYRIRGGTLVSMATAMAMPHSLPPSALMNIWRARGRV